MVDRGIFESRSQVSRSKIRRIDESRPKSIQNKADSNRYAGAHPQFHHQHDLLHNEVLRPMVCGNRDESHRNRRQLEGVATANNDGFSTEGGTIIVSVVENRAREICISKFDTSNVRQIIQSLSTII